MPGKVDLYNLGSVGVDLTKSKIHADDGSLLQSQNAVPDARGEVGALTKRDGLIAINSGTAGGSVTGALDIPLPAPAITSAAATRILFVGGTDWWFTHTTATYPTISSTSSASTTKGPGDTERAGTTMSALVQSGTDLSGSYSCVVGNRLYYIADYTVGTDAPAINVFKTTNIDVVASGNDRLFARVPQNPDVGAVSTGVTFLLAEGSYIYVAVHDAGTSNATHKGSVYRLDATTGQFLKLGATFPTGYVPLCLVWYQGRLWAGTYSEDRTGSGRVYWIRPGIDSTWTLDHTTGTGQGEIFGLAVYNGELYAATRGDSGKAGLVKKRTTTGTWSTSQTGSGTGQDQGYSSLVVFGSNLYAAYWNITGQDTASIEKFDGSTWSTVDSYIGSMQYDLRTDGVRIFALSVGQTNGRYLHSTDGTTWTTVTTPSTALGGFYGVLLV